MTSTTCQQFKLIQLSTLSLDAPLIIASFLYTWLIVICDID